MNQLPSIFNDVIGPVMRGPSSSHVAAALRIGKIIRELASGNIKSVDVLLDQNQPLAASYHGHGSDMGLVGGILGREAADSCLLNSIEDAKSMGIDISLRVEDLKTNHPNVYILSVFDDQNNEISMTALSTGGGAIEVILINGFRVSIKGVYYETLIYFDIVTETQMEKYISNINDTILDIEAISWELKDGHAMINIKSTKRIQKNVLNNLRAHCLYTEYFQISPVMPVIGGKECELPFTTIDEMLKYGKEKGMNLFELAIEYECARSRYSRKEVLELMGNLVEVMQKSIDYGLKGTEYKDRILGQQARLISENSDKLFSSNLINSVIECITAIMESKSSMGVIVAAPTAGASGGLPGTIIGTARYLDLSFDEIVKAMFAAGIIGVFIAHKATFAGEIGACQAECGSGSAMAAAGLVQLAGGTAKQAVDAASIALQNVLGLVCDPVAKRVEVPCLGKNILAGSNAISCANMSIAGFDKVIPLDEVIETLWKISLMIPVELRCTGNGGLAITKTAKKIESELYLV